MAPAIAKRLKVLMSAYACEPGRGSEPEVGWRWALQMARYHDVTVLTRANNEPAIRAALARLSQPHPSFLFFDLPRPLLTWKRGGLPVALYYFLWQAAVRWKFRNQLGQFDLIHHVTFNSFRQPGLWWFCPRPVLLGPLGGGQICPWQFFSLMRGRRLAELIRSWSVIASPLLPNLWLSFGTAAKVLVANRDTLERIPGVFRHKVSKLLETGIAEDLLGAREPRKEASGHRLIWLSRLQQIKAPELVLRAFALARHSNPDLCLTIVGTGPLEKELRRLAQDLAVSSAVVWKGPVPHAEVLSLLAGHDLFVFSSLRDTSGNVLLEAMAAGLPAVTLRHQGAAEIATDETAIRVEPRTVQQTTAELAEAMLKLAASPDLRASMGRAAQARLAELFAWERKAEQMNAIYAGVSATARSPRR